MMNKEKFMELLNNASLAGGKVTQDAPSFEYPCGGAWLTMSGRHPLVYLFKKYGTKNDNWDYDIANYRMGKNYNKGFSFHDYNKYSQYHSQSMRVAIEKYEAIAKVLEGAGFENLYVHNYID